MNTAPTIRELLHEAESKLHNSDSARLDAEILLCNVLDVDRSRLYSAPENIIPSKQSTGTGPLLMIANEANPLPI